MMKTWGLRAVFTAIIISAASILLGLVLHNPVSAAQSVPYKMNFQGRLNDSTGTPLTVGTYNMKFRIFSVASGGTALWTEQHAVSGSTGVSVTAGGLFSVQIDVTSIASSFNNASALYFEVELPTPATATCGTGGCESYTEGAMTPRSAMASAAYAINADMIDGIDGASIAQLGTNNTFTGTSTFSNTATFNSTGLFSVNNAAAVGIQNTSGTKVFTADTSGLKVQIGSSTTDANAALFVVDSYNNASDPTGTTGAIYYNTSTNTFRCYQAGAWANCITAAPAPPTLQLAYDNSGSPATITTTAAKGVSIVAGAAPTTNLFTVDNTANPTATNNANGVDVNYAGGAGAIEGSGMRVDFAPGSGSGSTWSGLRIVANPTGAGANVSAYGIKLEGPTSPGVGTEKALYVGTGWDIGMDIQSGGLQLAAQADPAAPAAGNLRIYSKDIAGRVMPKWVGPSGVDTPFQANLGFNRVSMMVPAGGAVLTSAVGGFGSTFTNTGTVANPTPVATNLLTSVRRTTFSSGATAGTVASHRQSVLQVSRGNAAGRGGFFYTIRFGTSTLAAGNRAFVGLADVVSVPTNVDPTTNATPGKIGMAINANTGNWNFVYNVTGSAPTVVSLGSIPVATTDLYELVLFSAPNGSSIGYRVTDLSTGGQMGGSISANIPANTTFLAPQFWITNNATAAAAIIDFSGWYLESDQ